jgi:hypothetical protein
VVGVVTTLRIVWSGVRIWIGARDLVLFQNRPDRMWSLPRLLLNGYQCSFQRVMRSELKGNHYPPSSAELKNKCSYAFVAWTRKTFTPLGGLFSNVRQTASCMLCVVSCVREAKPTCTEALAFDFFGIKW